MEKSIAMQDFEKSLHTRHLGKIYSRLALVNEKLHRYKVQKSRVLFYNF